tara:strand:- start:1399 stop:2679 length:1281 start_codon:yes stop_codon:yes gene_type:complete
MNFSGIIHQFHRSKASLYARYLIGVLLLVYCYIQALKGGDFRIYMGAADLLRTGQNCYNEWIHLSGDNYGQYSYSPFFATLLIPFTYLPKGSAEFLFLVANLFFIKRILRFLKIRLQVQKLSIVQQYAWAFLTLILSIRFALHNFEMVQMTIFLLFCCIEALHQAQQKRYWLSGLLLSLGIVIKILPLVMLPYFLFRKHWQPLFYFLLFMALFMFTPALFFGFEINHLLLHDWWEIINPNNTQFIAEQNKFGDGIHSLSALLAAYFSDTPSFWGIENARIIKVLSQEQLSLFLSSLRLLFVVFTIYFLRTLPFQKAKSKGHEIWELSYILAVVPLIFPHQQKYAFFFLLPAIATIAFVFVQQKMAKQKWIVLLLSLFFLLAVFTTDGIIGKELSRLSQHYKTITFGTFCLIAALALSKNKFLNSKQ